MEQEKEDSDAYITILKLQGNKIVTEAFYSMTFNIKIKELVFKCG